jgi:predicted dehydrogenase
MAKKKTVNISIVGLGYWGPKLIDKFQSLPDVAVTRLCDTREDLVQKFSAEHGIPGVASLDELLRDSSDIDGVVIAVPPQAHFKVAKKVLEAGKHVFVEKPLAMKKEDADKLVELAKERNCILFVDHTFCFDKVVQKIRQLHNSGDLSHVQYARFDWLGARPKERGPSVLWDSGPHAFSMLLFLLNKKPISISMRVVGRLANGIPSAVMGRVSLEDGSSADIALAWKDQIVFEKQIPKTARISLVGSKQSVMYEGSFGSRISLVHAKPVTVSHEPHDFDREIFPIKHKETKPLDGACYEDEPLKAACVAFVNAIRTGKTHISDGLFGARVVLMLEAVEQSMSSGGSLVHLL